MSKSSNDIKPLNGVLEAIQLMSNDEYIDLMCSVDIISWIENRRILKGRPFSFKNRDYLIQPYRDEYPRLLFMKGRQVEMSEFTMNWMLRNLDKYPYTSGLHAFPRSSQAKKFSKERLSVAITESQYLEQWQSKRESEQFLKKFVKDIDESGKVKYNSYILGATWQSHKDTVGDAARGMSIDFIAYDERQDHPNDVEAVLGEGASHSEFKKDITLGTPKLPGIQFDMQWKASNQMYWVVKCDKCGKRDPITIENIIEDAGGSLFYGCKHCKNEINRLNGEWVEMNPHNNPEYHGYHINQLMVPWITASEIIRKQDSVAYTRRRFHNEVLGESYGGDDIPINIAMLYECSKNQYSLGDYDKNDVLYGGVDWGSNSYGLVQTAGGRLIDLHISAESDPREHPRSMARFFRKYSKNIKKVVCDAGPDITRFYNLRDECKDITREVYACYYTAPPARSDIIWNKKENIVQAGRSEIIDRVIDSIHSLDMILPGESMDSDIVDKMIEHFTNISATSNKNASGNTFVIYENTGPDHFFHAKVYATIASDGIISMPIGEVAPQIKNLRRSDEHETSGIAYFGNRKKSPGNSQYFPVFTNNRRRSGR